MLLPLALAAAVASAAPASAPVPALPLALADLESLLQRFSDTAYLKGFRHLGDERDFDHGHFLFAAGSARPVAILYHTQELAAESPDGPYGYLDADARNWLQWIDRGTVENARRYLRRDYPSTPAWDWFRAMELPGLLERRTITDKMIDPGLLALDLSRTRQWVFRRADCAASLERRLRVLLPPPGGAVCLLVDSD